MGVFQTCQTHPPHLAFFLPCCLCLYSLSWRLVRRDRDRRSLRDEFFVRLVLEPLSLFSCRARHCEVVLKCCNPHLLVFGCVLHLVNLVPGPVYLVAPPPLVVSPSHPSPLATPPAPRPHPLGTDPRVGLYKGTWIPKFNQTEQPELKGGWGGGVSNSAHAPPLP